MWRNKMCIIYLIKIGIPLWTTILHWCCQFPCIRQVLPWYDQFIICKRTFVIITKSYFLLTMLQWMASWLFRCTAPWTPTKEICHQISICTFMEMLGWPEAQTWAARPRAEAPPQPLVSLWQKFCLRRMWTCLTTQLWNVNMSEWWNILTFLT